MKAEKLVFFFFIVTVLNGGSYELDSSSDRLSVEKSICSSFSFVDMMSDVVTFQVSSNRTIGVEVTIDGIAEGSYKGGEFFSIALSCYHEVSFYFGRSYEGLSFFPRTNGVPGVLVRASIDSRSAGFPLRKVYGVLLKKETIGADGKTYEIVESEFDENGTPLPYRLEVRSQLDETGRLTEITNVLSSVSTPTEIKSNQRGDAGAANFSTTRVTEFSDAESGNAVAARGEAAGSKVEGDSVGGRSHRFVWPLLLGLTGFGALGWIFLCRNKG